MSAYPLVLYEAPQRALMLPRLAAPIPERQPATWAVSSYTVLITPPPHKYRIGQEVVVPMSHHTWRGKVTVFQAAVVVKCHRHYGENWYEVNIARREGKTFGYKVFPFAFHEDAISLDFAQAVVQTTTERRLVTADFAAGFTERTMERTRDGIRFAA